MKIVYKFRAQGRVLERYIKSKARVSTIMGPLGSGKTWASCEKLFKLMCEQAPNARRIRKTRFMAIRNTYSDLTTTTIRDWLDLFGELGTYKEGKLSPPTHTIKIVLEDKTIVHSELIFLALDRPLAIRKLRGTQITGFWLNELKELDKEIVDMCDLRHGRFPSKIDGGPTWHGMLADLNACDDEHYYYELAEITKPEGWEFFTQPGGVLRVYEEINGRKRWTGKWMPNPDAENLNNLPPKYYEAGLQGKSDAWIAVNLGNEYGHDVAGKAVYEMSWNDATHVSTDIKLDPESTLYVGFDYGRTPACVLAQFIDGRLLVLDEFTASNMSVRTFGVQVLALIKSTKAANVVCVGDASGKNKSQATDDSPVSVLAELGLFVMPDSTSDIQARLGSVEFFLESMFKGAPVFKMHPKCTTLRKGFNGGYRFQRLQVSGERRYSDKPHKNRYSHSHDALQSICLYLRGSAGTKAFERPESKSRW